MIKSFNPQIILNSRINISQKPKYRNVMFHYLKKANPYLLFVVNKMRNDLDECSEYPTYFIIDTFFQHNKLHQIPKSTCKTYIKNLNSLSIDEQFDYIGSTYEDIKTKNNLFFQQLLYLSSQFGDSYESMLVYNIINEDAKEYEFLEKNDFI